MLSWEEFIREGIVRKISIDKNLILSLLKTSDEGLNFFKDTKVKEDNSSTLFKNYYDALREICEALALSRGYKIYQHEAITSFLKNILREDRISYKFDRFRILRNGVHYYGKIIPEKETEKSINEIKEIIGLIKRKYLNEYK